MANYQKNIEDFYIGSRENTTYSSIMWYPCIHEYIKGYEGNLSIDSAIFSLMSVNTHLIQNYKKFEHYKKTGEFKGLLRNKFERLVECNGEEDCVKEILNGDKICNFYMNIFNPLDINHVTIDRWSARIAGLETRLSKKSYKEIKESYIIIAEKYKIIPNQLQAMTWIVKRDKK